MNKSARTSINKNKVPYLFTHNRLWRLCSTNLDIGGGRYDTATQYLQELFGIENTIYDPYNRSQEDNEKALRKPIYTTCTLSNVLNVILSKEERKEALQLAKRKASHYVFITVYEGNRTGIPSETQTNMKLKDYLSEIKEVFTDNNIQVKNKIITITMW